jgi:hypothetical protein
MKSTAGQKEFHSIRPLMVLGVFLAALGIISFVIPEVYCSGKRTTLENRNVKISARTDRVIPFPPLLAGGVTVAGVLLMLMAARR